MQHRREILQRRREMCSIGEKSSSVGGLYFSATVRPPWRRPRHIRTSGWHVTVMSTTRRRHHVPCTITSFCITVNVSMFKLNIDGLNQSLNPSWSTASGLDVSCEPTGTNDRRAGMLNMVLQSVTPVQRS